jgi:hypothetical protein
MSTDAMPDFTEKLLAAYRAGLASRASTIEVIP